MRAILISLSFAWLLSGCAGSFEKYFNQAANAGYDEQGYYGEQEYADDIIDETGYVEQYVEQEVPQSSVEWEWQRVDCAYKPIAEDANIDTALCGDPYAATIRARSLRVAYQRYLAYDIQSDYPLAHRLVKKLPKSDYIYKYNPKALDDDWFGTKYEYKSPKELHITIQDDECKHQEDYLKFFDLGNGKVKIISAQDPC